MHCHCLLFEQRRHSLTSQLHSHATGLWKDRKQHQYTALRLAAGRRLHCHYQQHQVSAEVSADGRKQTADALTTTSVMGLGLLLLPALPMLPLDHHRNAPSWSVRRPPTSCPPVCAGATQAEPLEVGRCKHTTCLPRILRRPNTSPWKLLSWVGLSIRDDTPRCRNRSTVNFRLRRISRTNRCDRRRRLLANACHLRACKQLSLHSLPSATELVFR
jgi:hypothetical protein